MNELSGTILSSPVSYGSPEDVDAQPASRSGEPCEEEAAIAEESGNPAAQKLSDLADSFNSIPHLNSGTEAAHETAATGEASEISHNPPQANAAGTLEKHPLKIGAFSGNWVAGKDSTGKEQNSVDLHVQGELGKSMDKQDLLAYLKSANAFMQSHHENTGTPGELEWHPTGAVVTKGAVQLLSETLGGQTFSGSLNKTTARFNTFWRKNISSSGQQSRNKMADRIDKDIQPEYFSYLNALKGVKGVSITPITMNREKVAGFEQLSGEDQVKAFDQNMLENSDWGKQRFKQYVDEYNADPDFVPSLKIKIDQQHLPALISTLEKQGK